MQKMKTFIKMFVVFVMAGVMGGTVLAVNNTAVADSVSANIVNVKDYGAVGNGVTDDSLAYKKAFFIAVKKHLPLYFPNGEYVLNDMDLATSQNITVEGESQDGVVLMNPGKITCQGNVTFQNITIVKNDETFLYLKPSGYIKLDLENVTFKNDDAYNDKASLVGCYLTSTKTGISNVKITNCDISKCKYAINLQCSIKSGLISENNIYDLGTADSSDSVIAIMVGLKNSDTAVANNITISNNTIKNIYTALINADDRHTCEAQGIRVQGGKNVVIENNYIENVVGGYDHEGIYCKAPDVEILNNTLINAGDGDGSIVDKISVVGSNIHIAANKIVNDLVSAIGNDMNGIYVNGCNTVIENNDISIANGTGIIIKECDNVVDAEIKNNTITAGGISGISVANITDKAEITGNTVTMLNSSKDSTVSSIKIRWPKVNSMIDISNNTVSSAGCKIVACYQPESNVTLDVTYNQFSFAGTGNSIFDLKNVNFNFTNNAISLPSADTSLDAQAYISIDQSKQMEICNNVVSHESF